MNAEIINEKIEQLLILQQEEINGYHTYKRLAEIIKDKRTARLF